eukprot:6718010-Pyramimonas_sp.AAC.1
MHDRKVAREEQEEQYQEELAKYGLEVVQQLAEEAGHGDEHRDGEGLEGLDVADVEDEVPSDVAQQAFRSGEEDTDRSTVHKRPARKYGRQFLYPQVPPLTEDSRTRHEKTRGGVATTSGEWSSSQA